MVSTTVWVHHDALSREHPVFERAGEGARALFVFDPDDYRTRGWSLKRLVFVVECVEDMDAEVVEGPLIDTLKSIDGPLLTARTPDPHYREVIEAVRKSRELTTVKERPFATVGDTTDLKRFFRYWKKAKKSAMNPHG